MFTLKSATVQPMTHDLAIKFRDMKPWAGERELQKQRLDHLKRKIEHGLAVPFQWAYGVLPDETEIRINAQHSSTVLAAMNGNMPEGLMATVSEYALNDMEDAALLFRQYDDRVSSRKEADISGVYQGLYDPIKNVDRRVAQLAIQGIVWYNKMVVGLPTLDGDDIYTMFREARYHTFIVWLGNLIDIKQPELKKVAVVAAIFGTFDTNSQEAKLFWENVARGGDPDDQSNPATVLDEWLQSVAKKIDKATLNLKPAEFYQGCVMAWNAQRHNRGIKEIRHDTRKGLNPIER
jgi:hypothetical protein